MPFAPVQLPSGRWQGGFRHPVTRRKVTQTFDYAYEAEAWSLIAETKAREGVETPAAAAPVLAPVPAPKAPGITVEAYGTAYLARRAGFLARATLDIYGVHLRGMAKRVTDRHLPIAGRDLTALTKPDVEQWITDSRAAGEGIAAINGRLKFLRTLCLDAIEEGVIVGNPTRGIGYLTGDNEVDRTLTRTEEAALLLAADEQLAAAVLVALDAGLRWQEVYALTVANVVGEYLYVTQAVERSGGIRKHTKSHRSRIVPMTKRLTAALEPLVKAARAEAGQEGLLFPAPGRTDRPNQKNRPVNKPWDYNNHRRTAWGPLLFAVGAAVETWTPTARIRKYGPEKGKPVMQRRIEPTYGFHALRHTYGSRLAAAGVPRTEIAQLMGHADEATTARYIHAGDDGRRLDLVREALEGDAG